jgi:lysophospholipase L1-like esterase
MQRAPQAPEGAVLLFGDSIVERQYLPTLCGLPVFNVGLSSSRIQDHEPMLKDLVSITRPRWIIVSSGANDVMRGTPIADWRRSVRNLLEVSGKRTIVFGIPAGSGNNASAYNDVLAAEAAAFGAAYIEPLPSELTTDGVHPSGAGYKEWAHKASVACKMSTS